MRKLAGWAALMFASALLAGCKTHPPPPVVNQNPYTFPLLSPGAQFSEAPPAVQRTIRAEAGAAPLSDIRKYHIGTETVYGVFFQNPEVYPPLLVKPDGSVLNPNLSVAVGGVAPGELSGVLTAGPVSRVSLGALPPKGVQAIQQLAPDAEIDVITKESHADETVYKVTFKNGRHAPIYLDGQGKVLKGPPSWMGQWRKSPP